MKQLIATLLAALVLAGCSVMSAGTDHRKKAIDALGDFWCGLSGEERTAVAERREYSEAFQEFLNAQCGQNGQSEEAGRTALAQAQPAALSAVLDSTRATLQGNPEAADSGAQRR